MRKRRPVDSGAAESQAVDYLLREFRKLPKKTGGGAGAASTGSGGGPIETSYLVASSQATDKIKAVADYVCDGTDDQEEINAAVAAAQAWSGYYRIQLSRGTYYSSGNWQMDLARLQGVGVDQTILEFGDGAYTGDGAVYAPYGCSDLNIEVYTTGASTPYCAIETGQFGTIENVNVIFAPTDPSSLSVAAVRLIGGRIVGCNIENVIADAYGIQIIGSGYRNPLLVSECFVDCADTGAAGIWVAGDHCNIVDNVVIDSVGNGIHLHSTANRAVVVGNRVDGSSNHGIYVYSDTGASIISANLVNDSGADGIYIDADSSGDMVGPNQITNSVGVDVNDNGTGTVLIPDTAGVLASVVKHDNFNEAGALSVGSGAIRYYTQTDRTITGCYAMVSGAPSGSAAIFDVNIDGTTAYTTQGNRPTVAAAGYLSTVTVPDVTAWDTGSYLTIDVDAANSATDLILVVQYTEA